ncbi:MAG TPA: hypothetical protein VIA62_08780 [Thermoanaerobaculia bacterium]|jgi:hypothetical protein|nr:hypothetical protein [Thermoanaerobaculia bacterium]
MRFLKTLLSKPYFVPALAILAALAALLLGYRATHTPAPSPMEVLRQDTLETSYDPAYWTALARERPELYQSALLYCVAHPGTPNCDALRRQAFTTSLEHSAAAPKPPLEPAAVPAQPTPIVPATRPR